jgi:hypothetical protein
MELPQSVAIKTVGKIVIIFLILAVLVSFLLVRSCEKNQVAKTETKVSKNQTEAAQASGSDAANTVGNRMSIDTHTDTVTREITHEIRTLPGSNTSVDADVQRAGIRGLCQYAAYRSQPDCL